MKTKLLTVALIGLSAPSHVVADVPTSPREGKPSSLEAQFVNPPDAARPGVYWYFLDGNRDPKAMTADLESLVRSGMGSMVFLEVDLGVPRGPVNFMSDSWQDMFAHAVREAERLGLEIVLGSGPGWAGSGGPWVKPEESMLHLVASVTHATGPQQFRGTLPVPPPRKPFFNTLSPEMIQQRNDYYRDVAVLAFPTPIGVAQLQEPDEKALYYRPPFTSAPGVRPYWVVPGPDQTVEPDSIVPLEKVVDITKHLQADGTLDWEVPSGDWTIMRFVARNNGSNTRPAPLAGLGFECDKFSSTAFDNHLREYMFKLLKKTEPRKAGVGWTRVHIDSWEMGAQNWGPNFRDEFERRRGYDPLPWYPTYSGRIITSLEVTERFLWDMRQTAQELVIENHAGHLKKIAHDNGMALSIEPYDMNPTADLALGAVADVPMAEFWANTFNSAFSCIEASSIAHTMGRPMVGAEAFTSVESFILHPAGVKNQLDWAFATGINQIFFHTFQHQPLGDDVVPGMTFGSFGINWNRNQTWWPMVDDINRYITRCSFLLRQGVTVADIIYLTPEGAPHVFRPPTSAVTGDIAILPDRRGYNFDGCAPQTLLARAQVQDGKIAFPEGSNYSVLVLPAVEAMTPELLTKIGALIEQGATVVGSPPLRSPSLEGYPECDADVRKLVTAIWGTETVPTEKSERVYGKGRIFWGGELYVKPSQEPGELYPAYDLTAGLLQDLNLPENFQSTGPIRYTHRQTDDYDIFFVGNRNDREVAAQCSFRTDGRSPALWDGRTGEVRSLPEFLQQGGVTTVPLNFDAHQSFFVVFQRRGDAQPPRPTAVAGANFAVLNSVATLDGPWEVSFPPGRGGPERITFPSLQDWTTHSESGIRYFSGIATYRKTFDLPKKLTPSKTKGSMFLDVGIVRDVCRVRLNGKDLGVVWTAPWRVDISEVAKSTDNRLEIEVANRWPNRLIGDQQPEDANVRTLSWENGLLAGETFSAGRYTFMPQSPYKADSPLLSSGLLGPVSILTPAAQ